MHRSFVPGRLGPLGRVGRSGVIGAGLAALALALPGAGQGQTQAQAAAARKPLVLHAAGARPANGLIVKLKSVSAAERAQALGVQEASPRERLQGIAKAAGLPVASRTGTVGRDGQLLTYGRLLGAAEAADMAARLATRPEVEWVEPNTRERRLQVVTPNDLYFSQQWWLQPVSGSDSLPIDSRLRGVPGFQSAWSATTGSSAAVVAVLDTGITSHPDLSGHVLAGYDFVSDPTFSNDGDGVDADPSDPGDWVSQADINGNSAFDGCTVEDSSWHGTDIAGLVAAVTNNSTGVAGINWDGRILPVRVAGKCGADVADIVNGMRWAAGLPVAGVPNNPTPARVLNISFGGGEACSAAYQSAIDDVAAVGAVVVAAAGNEQAAPDRPANCSGVVAVGAVNRDGFKTNYSNFGAGMTVMTVGGDPMDFGRWGPYLGDSGLLTLDNSGTTAPSTPRYASVFGTSFSTPLVSGAVSLMLAANPALTRQQVITGLQLSARPHVTAPKIGACSASNPGRCICSTATCGAGLLDAAEAVRFAQVVGAGGVYTAPNWPSVVLQSAEIDAAVAQGQDADGTVAPPSGGGGDSGGGGGALGIPWLLGLALAIAALIGFRRRAG